ncbi:hypothetical protein CLIB1423_17S01354 [[Candida] railenensis]|uniref:tRNA(Ile)-lysidine synthetase n=1 Tax=[Candida] railenensis TaxID=45579 RepID=A0A9P0QUH3_9ASCO|nr:hypothetical protein CLIB1423_17S01354 [[Candida] railenensis]
MYMPISSEVFAQVIGKYFPKGVPPSVIALSGGVDSMCLAYLLSQHKKLYQPDMSISAMTIDHAYRIDSEKEATAVGDLVSKWGLTHNIKRLHYETTNVIKSTKFEEIARQKRYQELKQYCNENHVRNIFVAHNLNDQFETYLYRLLGESTILGLRSLKPISLIPVEPETPTEVTPYIIRPLLEFSKSEIIDTCKSNGIRWFEDPTNKDTNLTIRNKLRYYISEYVPQNIQKDPSLEVLSTSNLKSTIDKISELDDYIKRQAIKLENQLISENRLEFLEDECKMKIIFTYEEFESNSTPVLSRLLYGNIYPVASTVEYHWKYARLERAAVPKFKKLFDDLRNSDTLNTLVENMTFLNILFTVTVDDISSRIMIELRRAPVANNMLEHVAKTFSSKDQWGNWFLWDNRYWMKIKVDESENQVISSITITPFVKKLHLKILQSKFYDFGASDGARLGQDPMIIVKYKNSITGELDYDICVPKKITSNPKLRAEMELKKNIFKNIMEINDDYNDEVGKISTGVYEYEQPKVHESSTKFIMDNIIKKAFSGEQLQGKS